MKITLFTLFALCFTIPAFAQGSGRSERSGRTDAYVPSAMRSYLVKYRHVNAAISCKKESGWSDTTDCYARDASANYHCWGSYGINCYIAPKKGAAFSIYLSNSGVPSKVVDSGPLSFPIDQETSDRLTHASDEMLRQQRHQSWQNSHGR